MLFEGGRVKIIEIFQCGNCSSLGLMTKMCAILQLVSASLNPSIDTIA